jgi:hypothetical protein
MSMLVKQQLQFTSIPDGDQPACCHPAILIPRHTQSHENSWLISFRIGWIIPSPTTSVDERTLQSFNRKPCCLTAIIGNARDQNPPRTRHSNALVAIKRCVPRAEATAVCLTFLRSAQPPGRAITTMPGHPSRSRAPAPNANHVWCDRFGRLEPCHFSVSGTRHFESASILRARTVGH